MSQCHDIYEFVDDGPIEVEVEILTQCHDLYPSAEPTTLDPTKPAVTPEKEIEVPRVDVPVAA